MFNLLLPKVHTLPDLDGRLTTEEAKKVKLGLGIGDFPLHYKLLGIGFKPDYLGPNLYAMQICPFHSSGCLGPCFSPSTGL